MISSDKLINILLFCIIVILLSIAPQPPLINPKTMYTQQTSPLSKCTSTFVILHKKISKIRDECIRNVSGTPYNSTIIDRIKNTSNMFNNSTDYTPCINEYYNNLKMAYKDQKKCKNNENILK